METHNVYNFSTEETLRFEKSSSEGLTSAEAQKRLTDYGPNKLPRISPPKPWLIFLAQFSNPLIYVLLGVTVITFFLHDYVDSFAILGIIIINASIGFYQEIKAEKSLEKLEDFLAPNCKVLRDGEHHEIPSETLVPGDIVVIEPGSKITADLRIIECLDIKADESTLTGESLPSSKKVLPIQGKLPLGDRHNMLFSGTFITSGRGKAVVVATGKNTEFGKIADSLQKATPPPSPLEIQLSTLSRQIIFIVVICTLLVIATGLIRNLDPLKMFLTGVNLAVSVIPEGLPAVLTLTLAIGIRRMARQKAIIRYLPAVETLGSVTLVASDKTGTLTRDEMLVEFINTGSHQFNISGDGYSPEGYFHLDEKHINPTKYPVLHNLLKAAVLCNDSSLLQEKNEWKIVGDPTEGALIVAGAKGGIYKPETEEKYPRLDEIPFHTVKRYMATLHKDHGGDGKIIFLKGATEKILAFCETYYKNDRRHRLGSEELKKYHSTNQELASKGFRVLAIAMKDNFTGDKLNEKDLKKCTFLGLCAMSDSARPEALRSIRTAHSSKIRVVMLTGDHALTASSISKDLNINSEAGSQNPYIVKTGEELDAMSEKQLKQTTTYCNTFARISPLNKLSLVKRFQNQGHLVAVTGDGINDAPALKQADIGIAMGKNGTDVTREASDMVLTDDNFASIIIAIEEGRTVFQNIKRVLLYLLSTNVGELFVILATLLIGLPLPLEPVQILWINLITDGAGTVPLAMEPKHANIMKYPPRPPATPILDTISRWRILIVALTMTVGTVSLFAWELSHNGYMAARTVAFEAMVLFQVFNVLNCRSMKDSIFKTPLFNNVYVIWAFILSWSLTVFAIYIPSLQKIFHTTPLSATQWIRIVAVSLSVILVIEFEKKIRRRYGSRY